MKTYTKEELAEIFKLHNLWLNNKGGLMANLSGADLSGANLSRANLFGANLSMANLSLTKISEDEYLVKSIFINGSRHSVSWWGLSMISIGCHRKEIDWWKENYKMVGEKEGYTIEQQEEYYQYILICEQMQKSLKP